MNTQTITINKFTCEFANIKVITTIEEGIIKTVISDGQVEINLHNLAGVQFLKDVGDSLTSKVYNALNPKESYHK